MSWNQGYPQPGGWGQGYPQQGYGNATYPPQGYGQPNVAAGYGGGYGAAPMGGGYGGGYGAVAPAAPAPVARDYSMLSSLTSDPAILKLNLSPEETELYTKLYGLVNPAPDGTVHGSACLPLFLASSLPQQVLKEIWAVMDAKNVGVLTRAEFYGALRLIALVQSGLLVTPRADDVTKLAPLPRMPPHTPAAAPKPSPAAAPAAPTGLAAIAPGTFATPTSTPAPLAPQPAPTATGTPAFAGGNYTPSVASDPFGGSNASGTPAFPGSAAPAPAVAFPGAQAAFPGATAAFPSSGAADPFAASAFPGAAPAFPAASTGFPTGGAPAFPGTAAPAFPGTAAPAFPGTSAAPAFPGSAPAAFPGATASTFPTPSPVAPTSTPAVSAPAPSPAVPTATTPAQQPLAADVILAEDRAKYMPLWERSQRGGFLPGEVARDLFVDSGLTQVELRSIWQLSDVTGDGRLDLEEFMICMHYIRQVLTYNARLPETLPASLRPGATPVPATAASTPSLAPTPSSVVMPVAPNPGPSPAAPTAVAPAVASITPSTLASSTASPAGWTATTDPTPAWGGSLGGGSSNNESPAFTPAFTPAATTAAPAALAPSKPTSILDAGISDEDRYAAFRIAAVEPTPPPRAPEPVAPAPMPVAPTPQPTAPVAPTSNNSVFGASAPFGASGGFDNASGNGAFGGANAAFGGGAPAFGSNAAFGANTAATPGAAFGASATGSGALGWGEPSREPAEVSRVQVDVTAHKPVDMNSSFSGGAALGGAGSANAVFGAPSQFGGNVAFGGGGASGAGGLNTSSAGLGGFHDSPDTMHGTNSMFGAGSGNPMFGGASGNPMFGGASTESAGPDVRRNSDATAPPPRPARTSDAERYGGMSGGMGGMDNDRYGNDRFGQAPAAVASPVRDPYAAFGGGLNSSGALMNSSGPLASSGVNLNASGANLNLNGSGALMGAGVFGNTSFGMGGMGGMGPMQMGTGSPSLNQSAHNLSLGGMGGMGGMQMGTPPSEVPWVVTGEIKAKYDALFERADANQDKLISADEAHILFMRAGISTNELMQIWELSDIDADGHLDAEEWALAMHLINEAREGINPPHFLSVDMVPPSKRHLQQRTSNNISDRTRHLFEGIAPGTPSQQAPAPSAPSTAVAIPSAVSAAGIASGSGTPNSLPLLNTSAANTPTMGFKGDSVTAALQAEHERVDRVTGEVARVSQDLALTNEQAKILNDKLAFARQQYTILENQRAEYEAILNERRRQHEDDQLALDKLNLKLESSSASTRSAQAEIKKLTEEITRLRSQIELVESSLVGSEGTDARVIAKLRHERAAAEIELHEWETRKKQQGTIAFEATALIKKLIDERNLVRAEIRRCQDELQTLKRASMGEKALQDAMAQDSMELTSLQAELASFRRARNDSAALAKDAAKEFSQGLTVFQTNGASDDFDYSTPRKATVTPSKPSGEDIRTLPFEPARPAATTPSHEDLSSLHSASPNAFGAPTASPGAESGAGKPATASPGAPSFATNAFAMKGDPFNDATDPFGGSSGSFGSPEHKPVESPPKTTDAFGSAKGADVFATKGNDVFAASNSGVFGASNNDVFGSSNNDVFGSGKDVFGAKNDAFGTPAAGSDPFASPAAFPTATTTTATAASAAGGAAIGATSGAAAFSGWDAAPTFGSAESPAERSASSMDRLERTTWGADNNTSLSGTRTSQPGAGTAPSSPPRTNVAPAINISVPSESSKPPVKPAAEVPVKAAPVVAAVDGNAFATAGLGDFGADDNAFADDAGFDSPVVTKPAAPPAAAAAAPVKAVAAVAATQAAPAKASPGFGKKVVEVSPAMSADPFATGDDPFAVNGDADPFGEDVDPFDSPATGSAAFSTASENFAPGPTRATPAAPAVSAPAPAAASPAGEPLTESKLSEKDKGLAPPATRGRAMSTSSFGSAFSDDNVAPKPAAAVATRPPTIAEESPAPKAATAPGADPFAMGSDPFAKADFGGAADPFAASGSPFGAPAAASGGADPFASENPFAAAGNNAAFGADPFAAKDGAAAKADPFASATGAADPFASAGGADPFGAGTGGDKENPFGGNTSFASNGAFSAGGFGNGADPFAAGGDPFGSSKPAAVDENPFEGADPFGSNDAFSAPPPAYTAKAAPVAPTVAPLSAAKAALSSPATAASTPMTPGKEFATTHYPDDVTMQSNDESFSQELEFSDDEPEAPRPADPRPVTHHFHPPPPPAEGVATRRPRVRTVVPVSTVASSTRWEKVLRSWPPRPSMDVKVKQLIRGGIPSSLRGAMWQLLSRSAELKSNNAGVYERYLNGYCVFEEEIERVVQNSYASLPHFSHLGANAIESMVDVLKCLALYDPDLGFSEDLGYVAVVVLSQVPNDEEAFWLMATLLDKYEFRALYVGSAPDLRQHMFVFKRLLDESLPDVARLLREKGIKDDELFSKWFATLFANGLPLSLSVRMYDVFLSEGFKIAFRCALHLMEEFYPHVLDSDKAGIIAHFYKLATNQIQISPDAFMAACLRVPLTSKRIQQLAKESKYFA